MLPMEKKNYTGRAVAWAWTEAKTENPQIVIDFEITQGEYKGERASDMYTLTENTTDWLFRMLYSLGWDGASIDNPVGLDNNEVSLGMKPEDAKDDKGQPKIDEETGEVMQRLRIFVNSGLSAIVKPLEANKKKVMAAKFKGALAAYNAKNRKGQGAAHGNSNNGDGPPPGHPANGGADDDIPF